VETTCLKIEGIISKIKINRGNLIGLYGLIKYTWGRPPARPHLFFSEITTLHEELELEKSNERRR
jgi:hypothetical protein